MSIARSVAEILGEHVTLALQGIDRMYPNVFVPRLRREAGVAAFFRFHRGYRFASSVPMYRAAGRLSARWGTLPRRTNVAWCAFARTNARTRSPRRT